MAILVLFLPHGCGRIFRRDGPRATPTPTPTRPLKAPVQKARGIAGYIVCSSARWVPGAARVSRQAETGERHPHRRVEPHPSEPWNQSNAAQ